MLWTEKKQSEEVETTNATRTHYGQIRLDVFRIRRAKRSNSSQIDQEQPLQLGEDDGLDDSSNQAEEKLILPSDLSGVVSHSTMFVSLNVSN